MQAMICVLGALVVMGLAISRNQNTTTGSRQTAQRTDCLTLDQSADYLCRVNKAGYLLDCEKIPRTDLKKYKKSGKNSKKYAFKSKKYAFLRFLLDYSK